MGGHGRKVAGHLNFLVKLIKAVGVAALRTCSNVISTLRLGWDGIDVCINQS